MNSVHVTRLIFFKSGVSGPVWDNNQTWLVRSKSTRQAKFQALSTERRSSVAALFKLLHGLGGVALLTGEEGEKLSCGAMPGGSALCEVGV